MGSDLGPNNFQRLPEDNRRHLTPARGNPHTRFDLQTLHVFWFVLMLYIPVNNFSVMISGLPWMNQYHSLIGARQEFFLLVD